MMYQQKSKTALNKLGKVDLVAQTMAAQAAVQDHSEVVSAIEDVVNKFAEERFNSSGKPRKFIWWTILNADAIYTLIKTIIKLIKDLKNKYESDAEGSN